MRKRFVMLVAMACMLALSVGLSGCGAANSIVGTWKANSSGNPIQFDSDGTYTYTSKMITELGYLEGSWEEYDSPSTFEAEGKEWKVYLVTNVAHSIQGDGDLGNKYKYSDELGDYYYCVGGDEIVVLIGHGNLERVVESGTFGDSMLEMLEIRYTRQ